MGVTHSSELRSYGNPWLEYCTRLPFTSVYRLHLLFVPLKCFEKDSFLWDQGEKCPGEMQHNDIYIRGLSIPKHLDTFFCES